MSMHSGQTALVTGASSGIGLELARCFAADGHDLILVARSEAALEAIALELSQAHGVTATVIPKDLFDLNAPWELHDEVRARGLAVDFLVNDAGQGVYGKFGETDIEDELRIIQLNVNALVVLTKLFLKDMLARGRGRILQLASVDSKAPAPYEAVYSGTKAFVYNFTLALAQELEGTGVTVTALRPGATDTDFFHKAQAGAMTLVQDGDLAPPDAVARDGYAALMAGRTAVVSGMRNKLGDKAARLVPDEVVARRMKKSHAPKPPGPAH